MCLLLFHTARSFYFPKVTPLWDSGHQWVSDSVSHRKTNPISQTRPKKLSPHNSLSEEKQPYSLHSLILPDAFIHGCWTVAGGRCERRARRQRDGPGREAVTQCSSSTTILAFRRRFSMLLRVFSSKSKTFLPKHTWFTAHGRVANLLATSPQSLMGVLGRISRMQMMARQKTAS